MPKARVMTSEMKKMRAELEQAARTEFRRKKAYEKLESELAELRKKANDEHPSLFNVPIPNVQHPTVEIPMTNKQLRLGPLKLFTLPEKKKKNVPNKPQSIASLKKSKLCEVPTWDPFAGLRGSTSDLSLTLSTSCTESTGQVRPSPDPAVTLSKSCTESTGQVRPSPNPAVTLSTSCTESDIFIPSPNTKITTVQGETVVDVTSLYEEQQQLLKDNIAFLLPSNASPHDNDKSCLSGFSELEDEDSLLESPLRKMNVNINERTPSPNLGFSELEDEGRSVSPHVDPAVTPSAEVGMAQSLTSIHPYH